VKWAPKHIPEIVLALWQHVLLSISSVLIGLVIGAIVVLMYLPIFELAGSLQ